ncbi:hypothetical protein [Methyloceanibacter sp. wino2]|uniref:hypothetical protein n=1 Tax=Methyloceanibacter sp. wino2 TaxID=2170729 RepID=UPI00131F3CF0|nr:hypothetical protein [Methyloceanibacter sp. wino2]
MPLLDDATCQLLHVAFDDLPPEYKARAYGVDYARLCLLGGGELFLTRYGWGLSKRALPKAWFIDQRYQETGQKLDGTGTVYRVPIVVPVGATKDVVVKFSRVAQDVPIFVDKPVAELVPRSVIDNACFNDPFEEFGLLTELRRGPFCPDRPPIKTKRPLAIYSPPREYKVWQLGRKEGLFAQHVARLKADQEKHGTDVPVTLHLKRDYILFFQWVKGLDAVQLYTDGFLTAEDLQALYHRSNMDLRAHDLVVLDHKPRHLILRPRRSGIELVARDGTFDYALIDFELLKHVPTDLPDKTPAKKMAEAVA